MADPDPAVYRVEDLVEILQCGRRQVYESIQRGEIPGVIRLGRSIRISRHAVEEWLGTGHNGTKDDELTGTSPLSNSEQEAPPHGEHGSSG